LFGGNPTQERKLRHAVFGKTETVMTPHKAYNDPSRVDAVDGEVTVNGPDGVGVSLTPDAAEETSRRLKAKAKQARQQAPSQSES
jgi:hypothetical protein